MIARTISLLITAAALAPLAAHASPENASVKACASAFASSMAAPGGAARGYRLDYRPHFGGSLADFYPTEYTFTMEARDPKSGMAIARATCSADSRGSVTSITTLPLASQPADR